MEKHLQALQLHDNVIAVKDDPEAVKIAYGILMSFLINNFPRNPTDYTNREQTINIFLNGGEVKRTAPWPHDSIFVVSLMRSLVTDEKVDVNPNHVPIWSTFAKMYGPMIM